MPRLVPNYLTMSPDGTVGANFSGHVSAQGIDLPVSTVLTNPDIQSAVRWLQQPNGSLVASMYGFKSGSLNAVFIQAIAAAAGGDSEATLLATDSAQLRGARLDADADPVADSGNTVSVAAFTATKNSPRLTLVDPDGKSDYAQLSSKMGTAISFGQIGTTGAIVQRPGGQTWTAIRTGVGSYEIDNLPAPVAGDQLPMVIPVSAGTRCAQISAFPTSTSFAYQVRETTAGGLVDFPAIFFCVTITS